MNYKRFSIRGTNPQTGRKKTVTLDVPNNTTPYELALKQATIKDPFEINEIPFEEPTERQIAYAKSLKIVIPRNACIGDVSALISRAVDSDGEPNQGLIEYASNRGLMFSEYIGKKALYNLIFNNLALVDKIAFFCFSVYRYLSDDRHANLDTSPIRDIFYSFAQQYEEDNKFVLSMEKYEGEDLRFFGKMKIKKEDYLTEITGGSVTTAAYKTVSSFLQTKLNTPLTRVKTIQGEERFKNNQKYNVYNNRKIKPENISHSGVAVDEKKKNTVLFHFLLCFFTAGLGYLIYMACKHWKSWKIWKKVLFWIGIIFYIVVIAASISNTEKKQPENHVEKDAPLNGNDGDE